MNNNDIVRNASVIMNHYERHRKNTVLRGREKKLNAHCKEEKKSVSQSSTHRQPITKEDNAWSTRAGQTSSNNE